MRLHKYTNNVSDLPKINKRILLIVDEFAKNKSQFSKIIGASQQVFNRIFKIDNRGEKYPKPSDEMIDSILENFPTVDRVWILTGEGKMLKSTKLHVAEPQEDYNKVESETIKNLRDRIADKNEIIQSKDELIQSLKNQLDIDSPKKASS